MTRRSLETTVIRFPNKWQAGAVYAPQSSTPGQIVEGLELPEPRALVVLNGGTAELRKPLRSRLSHLLQGGLARTAAREGITLITGGTDAGVFALLGQGLAKYGRSAPCIGVSVAELVGWPGHPQAEIQLEPHHSHFVLVCGKTWGDETRLMYDLVGALATTSPSLAIFVGGGEVTRHEMEKNVEQGREMILLEGSGRTTDAVLRALRNRSVDDPSLTEIAKEGRITPFDVGHEASALAGLLHSSLFGREGGS